MKKLVMIFIISFTAIFSDEIDVMQNQIENIDKGISESKKNVDKLKKEENEIIKKLDSIESELRRIKREYNNIEKEYDIINGKIDLGEKNITVINKELENKKEKINQMLLVWYKSKDDLKYDYILKGKTISDVFSREENIKILLDYQKENIEEIKDIRLEIEIQKETVMQEKRNLTDIKIKLDRKKRELDRKIAERNRVLKSLKNKEEYFLAKVEELKIEKREIQEKIEKIIRNRMKTETNLAIKDVRKRLGKFNYPINNNIKYGYNEKKRISGNNYVFTSGIEFEGQIGNRIHTAGGGEIIYSDEFESLGYVVIVDHGYGLVSVYGNLISSFKKVGDVVEKGETIGVLGISSTNGDAYLYFEMRLNTETIDPMIFFK